MFYLKNKLSLFRGREPPLLHLVYFQTNNCFLNKMHNWYLYTRTMSASVFPFHAANSSPQIQRAVSKRKESASVMTSLCGWVRTWL